jgi:hypothetical protein
MSAAVSLHWIGENSSSVLTTKDRIDQPGDLFQLDNISGLAVRVVNRTLAGIMTRVSNQNTRNALLPQS